MSVGAETDRVLAAVTAALNDHDLESFEPGRVQELVAQALGGEAHLTVDPGGGLHDESGARIGAIRRTPSGEWITERQNELAERSAAAIPAQPPPSMLRTLLTKLKVLG